MKLLASLFAGVCAGCLVHGAFYLAEKVTHPSANFITLSVRRNVQKLLARENTLISPYVRHVAPLLNEVPLPTSIDLPFFILLHALVGLSIWILAAVAFPSSTLLLLPLCIGTGAPLPYVWLKYQQAQFHTALLKSLPECLELQALVMEAGLDLNAGIQHYLDKGTPSPLQNLLKGVQYEIQMGRSRLEAFSNLSQRTSFPPLRDVGRGIVQALSLGTSLAPWLREQAAALPIKRMQIAEKKAAEPPLKLRFPPL